MNHVITEEVTIRCTSCSSVFYTVPFKELPRQRYSEEDLNVNGDLVLDIKDFMKFLTECIKESGK